MNPRKTEVTRKTNETDIRLSLDLDGSGKTEVSTGIGFLDHLVASLARHAGFDLVLSCRGDLQVDDHHTAEDCALVLGTALDRILEDRGGITRFGWAYAPLDEALARAVIDLSGRPFPLVDLGLKREAVGGLASENAAHFLSSFSATARCNLHVDVLRGENDHHRAEAAFKAVALALKAAVSRGGPGVLSTKGVLG
jgi:imidazoleglycerol phosphate dehydratase HisB